MILTLGLRALLPALAARRCYEKHGFERIDKAALPESFPVMAVDSVF